MENRTIELVKSINQRVGTLLRQERKLLGKSITEVSGLLKIDPITLARWEKGFGSPSGASFYAIIKLYGPNALKRAEALDFQLQCEKVHRNAKPLIPKPHLTLIRNSLD